ncbi:MAG TPA: hypothetical protein VNO81_07585, partial [Candidatus Nitrosotenuis sp.]|nr:hypothetical protein [Candidatus Nitrosotenuis sp.]
MTHTATLEGRPARTRARLEERLRDSVLCAVGPDTVLEGGRLDMLRSLSHSLPVFLVHLEAEAEEEALEVCEEAAGFTRLRYRPPRGGAGWGALHRHLIERRAIRPILLLEDP